MSVSDRVRAARIQAGYLRRPDLAAQLRLPRFGEKVLGQVERGERPLYEHEAVELARVLGVEAEWFYGSPPAGALQEILWKLDAIMDHLGITAAAEFSAAIEAGAATAPGTSRRPGQSRGAAGRPTAHSA
jgi:hypothetical protein